MYDNELQRIEKQYAKPGLSDGRTQQIKEIVNLKSRLKSDHRALGGQLFELLDSLDSLLCSNYMKIENMSESIEHLQRDNNELVAKVYSLEAQHLEKKGAESLSFVDFKRESMEIIIKKNEETVRTIEEYYKVRIEALNRKIEQLSEKLARKKKKKQDLFEKVQKLQGAVQREVQDTAVQCDLLSNNNNAGVSNNNFNILNGGGGAGQANINSSLFPFSNNNNALMTTMMLLQASPGNFSMNPANGSNNNNAALNSGNNKGVSGAAFSLQ